MSPSSASSPACQVSGAALALMRPAGAKVPIAYGPDAESDMWSKAMRIRGEVPTLTHVLRVAPHDEPQASADLPAGVQGFHAERRRGRCLDSEVVAAASCVTGCFSAPSPW